MPQTLLALLAILLLGFLLLSSQRDDVDQQKREVLAEYELAAADLAKARLDAVARYPFDEADIARRGVRTTTDRLHAIGPDGSEAAEWSFDDVDDFDGAPARPVSRTWQGHPLSFTDSVSVRYVDPTNPATVLGPSARTLAKEITVTVRALPVGWVGTPPVVAELRQVVTPATQAVFH